MRRAAALFWTGVLPALVAVACASPAAPPEHAGGADILLERDTETIEARVPRNATLEGLLRQHDLPGDLAHAVVGAAREVFNPRHLRADHPYRLVRTFDGLLRQFDYHIDSDRFLRIVRLEEGDEPAFEVEVLSYLRESALIAVRGEIGGEHTSLVAALNAAGENVQLAIAMAEIFSGEVDFNNEIQPGDSFELLFEKSLREGEFAGYGPVIAAQLTNRGRILQAFRFEGTDGKPAYYNEEGRSLRRFFLASPLRFEPRITSGFTHRRLHPIHRTYRPHLGVDYAAPQGAPVVAVADGTVVSAAWAGEGGRMVRLRHMGGYESYYLHLSAFAPGVRAGARVSQGQLIGRVGMTGSATGPHLDYRLRKNGVFVNPVAEHRRMPPAEPLSPALMPAFSAARDLAVGRFVGPMEAVPASAARDLPVLPAEAADADLPE
jgi:murein DD-endopeptidase MepM/ murein hydrolase activator NlpD